MNASTDEDTENMKPLNVETESEDMQVTLRCVSEHEDDDNQAQYKDIKVAEEQRTQITTMSEDNADSKEDGQKTEENPFEKILFSDTDDKANFELELEEENAFNFFSMGRFVFFFSIFAAPHYRLLSRLLMKVPNN